MKYIGIKFVDAVPMTAEVANEKGYRVNNNTGGGYEVTYEDGYKSWCPKDVFEKHNFEIKNEVLAQIIMDNYREIKLPELWQDGDILVDNDDPNRFVVKSNAWTGPWENHFKAHLLVNPTSIGESPIAIFCNADYHKADSEELRKFHELLHKHGKEWDAEKKQLVDWQWKPEEEEDYFFVSSDLSVEVTSYDGFDIDEYRIRCGNFFRTREKAEAAAERVKKALKGE